MCHQAILSPSFNQKIEKSALACTNSYKELQRAIKGWKTPGSCFSLIEFAKEANGTKTE
jgi:hypothetical protein